MTTAPPIKPNKSAKMVSSGVMNTAATTRVTTKKRTGSSPMVLSASISSRTFMVPSSAANAEPERPAKMIAVISGPNSRNIERPIRLAINSSAPNWRKGTAA